MLTTGRSVSSARRVGRLAAQEGGTGSVDDKHDVVVGGSQRGAQGNHAGDPGQLVQRRPDALRGVDREHGLDAQLGECAAEREGGPEAVRIRIPV